MTQERLREACCAFLFVGVFIGAVFATASQTVGMVTAFVAGSVVPFLAWRIASLNQREFEERIKGRRW